MEHNNCKQESRIHIIEERQSQSDKERSRIDTELHNMKGQVSTIYSAKELTMNLMKKLDECSSIITELGKDLAVVKTYITSSLFWRSLVVGVVITLIGTMGGFIYTWGVLNNRVTQVEKILDSK
jgi:hypothetical protein